MHMDELIKIAKETMKRQEGEHAPMFFIIDREENMSVVLMEMVDEQKEKAVEALKELVLKAGSSRYFHASAGWSIDGKRVEQTVRDAMRRLKKDPSPDEMRKFLELAAQMQRRPSEHPMRTEVLIVSEFEKGIGTKTVVVPFVDGEFKEQIDMGKEQGHSYNRFNVWAQEQYTINDDDEN